MPISSVNMHMSPWASKWNQTSTKNTALSPVNNVIDPWESVFERMDWGALEDASGFDEAKAEQRELLERALGTLAPYLNDPYLDVQGTFAKNAAGPLRQGEAFLGDLRSGVQALMDPESGLNQGVADRYKTGAREQLRALRTNAAAAGLPRSRDAMLGVMQSLTDRLAQAPYQAQDQAARLAAAGATGSAQVASGWADASRAAGLTFVNRLSPATQMAQILANTQVVTPLLDSLLQGIYGAGAAEGNYFGPVNDNPWSALNQ